MKLFNQAKKIIFLITIIQFRLLFAQEQPYSSYNYFYPQVTKFGDVKHLLGLNIAKINEDDIEEATDIFFAPLLNYSIQLGLPYGFNLQAGVNTNIITNQFLLGLKFNYECGRLGLAAGIDGAFIWGVFAEEGFDSKIQGLMFYPNLTIGYDFENFSISIVSELLLVQRLIQYADEIRVTSNYKYMSGISFGIYVEQPLWGDNFIVLGFKSNYLKFYYPTWIVFSSFNRFMYTPEFIVRLIL